jgi:hypothetical protein
MPGIITFTFSIIFASMSFGRRWPLALASFAFLTSAMLESMTPLRAPAIFSQLSLFATIASTNFSKNL